MCIRKKEQKMVYGQDILLKNILDQSIAALSGVLLTTLPLLLHFPAKNFRSVRCWITHAKSCAKDLLVFYFPVGLPEPEMSTQTSLRLGKGLCQSTNFVNISRVNVLTLVSNEFVLCIS